MNAVYIVVGVIAVLFFPYFLIPPARKVLDWLRGEKTEGLAEDKLENLHHERLGQLRALSLEELSDEDEPLTDLELHGRRAEIGCSVERVDTGTVKVVVQSRLYYFRNMTGACLVWADGFKKKKDGVGSGGACNSCLQYSRRRLKPQRLPWTLVQA